MHGALWFAGKAFMESDIASKIVFYNTSLELISGKNIQNYFRKLYKGNPAQDNAIEVIRELQNLRGKLVHNGLLGELSKKKERYLQLILLDALMKEQTGLLGASAFAKANEIGESPKA